MLRQWMTAHRERLVELIGDLVRIPTENMPPMGAERKGQDYVAARLEALGVEPEVYSLDYVAGLKEHALYWPGRDYAGRPNVLARVRGTGGGRSLILSGHMDTVPCGGAEWTRDPFGGEVVEGRLYGRGSYDMKDGVALYLFVLEALDGCGVRLKGDLLIESVVDEEFGGVNGTLAGRVRGDLADGAIISEPTNLRILPAQRGGRVLHILFEAQADVFSKDRAPMTAVDQLARFLEKLPEFARMRTAAAPHSEYYSHAGDPVPVAVTNISTSTWGVSEPITIPTRCRVELYFQAVPGERQADVEGQFHEWLRSVFPDPPRVEFPIRWLEGSAIGKDSALVTELAACAEEVLGERPPVEGLEAPCDMYVFHHFGVPAVLWGPKGANAHLPDEWVDIESALQAAQVLGEFVIRWCGVEG